jgi:hypothetical protein
MLNLNREKRPTTKMRTTFVIFGKLPNINTHSLGEYSPNLVTLPNTKSFYTSLTQCAGNIGFRGRIDKYFDPAVPPNLLLGVQKLESGFDCGSRCLRTRANVRI